MKTLSAGVAYLATKKKKVHLVVWYFMYCSQWCLCFEPEGIVNNQFDNTVIFLLNIIDSFEGVNEQIPIR